MVPAAWCTVENLLGPCVNATFDDGIIDRAIGMVSQVLYEMTGRRWPGLQSDVVRPAYPLARCGGRYGRGPLYGRGRQCGECGCYDDHRLIQLPGRPVRAITEVRVADEIVAPSAYAVVDGSWLVRRDGQPWPYLVDITADVAGPGQLVVDYTWGADPPPAWADAAGILACELATGWNPDTAGSCRLPKRVTQISRDGVTMAILDPLTLFAGGLTGLPEVDMMLGALRAGAKRSSAVYVAEDLMAHHRDAAP